MNPETAARYAAAYAKHIEPGTVLIGRDTRPSGPVLASAVSSSLRFLGFDVVDLGIAATPTVEIMVDELGAAGGVIITASHNGPEWNALKFLGPAGEFLTAEQMASVRLIAAGDGHVFPEPERIGSRATDDSADRVHIERILELGRIDPERIAAAGIRAAVDCVNGAGSRIVPALLGRLGVEVIELFTAVDEPFPHNPEPRPEHLSALSQAVHEGGADIGFACDPDADRLVLVDGAGAVLSEELTLALAADLVLGEERGPLVANMSTSRVIEDIGGRHGVPVHRAKVGEANVVEVMKEVGAVIGGEGNGGVIYPALHYGRDAMVAIALVLELLTEEGVSLAEKLTNFPRYHIIKEKVPFTGALGRIGAELRGRFTGRVNEDDGVRIDMEEGWVHLRASNTEPVIRIIAEAGSEERAREIVSETVAIINTGSENGTSVL
jgi:phosphomannomutase